MTSPIAALTLLPKRDARARHGYPWIYSNEIAWEKKWKTLDRGSLVRVKDARGDDLGVGIFNPNSLIAARILSRDTAIPIDKDYFKKLLGAALRLREGFFKSPYYRLVHAEADGMPGVVIDRFGDILVCEINTAGMQALSPLWLEALQELLRPKAVYLKSDSNAREQEGLEPETKFAFGDAATPVLVEENGCKFYCDFIKGQKTGWFYDHRANRAMMASLSAGKKVLDLYSYLGGFALACAKAGAARVVAVDASQAAADLLKKSASLSGVDQVDAVCGDVFEFLEKSAGSQNYDVVIADPPAFAKSAKDIPAAKAGYKKLAAQCAAQVKSGGYLFIASCSYHMNLENFIEAVQEGVQKSRRSGVILRQTGADFDHPAHLQLPQTSYLKGLLLRLD